MRWGIFLRPFYKVFMLMDFQLALGLQLFKKSLEILVDRSLNRFKDLYAAAGHPNCIFKINFEDLIKITNGSIEDIIE